MLKPLVGNKLPTLRLGVMFRARRHICGPRNKWDGGEPFMFFLSADVVQQHNQAL
jgi:hypothetical protein